MTTKRRRHIQPLTTSEYVTALSSSKVSDGQRTILEAQYHAQERSITSGALADLFGHSTVGPSNSMYGKLARKVAEACGRGPVTSLSPKDGQWWPYLSAGLYRGGRFVAFVLHDEVAAALEELEWVQNPARPRRFWLTTHWPPFEDEPEDHVAGGIWVPDGREKAAAALATGDRVLIYHSESGRTEVYQDASGARHERARRHGRGGIVAVGEALVGVQCDPNVATTRYKDGTSARWCWHASVAVLSRSGFVPRAEINKALGYAANYNLRGFGDSHSGLKELDQATYEMLLALFRGQAEIPAEEPGGGPPPKVGGHGGGGESEAHRRLKEFVAANPERILSDPGAEWVGTEVSFPTGDRADCVLRDSENRIVGVEIELHVGDEDLAGVLQAIKYRFMLEVTTKRTHGDSRAVLVAHSISKRMRARCARYDVECVVVDADELL